MSGKKAPLYPTARGALVGAIAAVTRALAADPDDELREVSFGLFSEGSGSAGWWWQFETAKRYASEVPSAIRPNDSLEQRVSTVILAWDKAIEHYAQDGAGQGEGGRDD